MTSEGLAPPRSEIVTVKNVGKVFERGVVALHDVTFSLFNDEFVSVVGPSGCGKSTFLNLLASFDRASSGSVNVASGLWQHAGKTAFVPQESSLMPWLSVLENVLLPLRLTQNKNPHNEQLARETLELMGLSEFALAYPQTLSGGMKMRVSLARALVTSPDLLLMDEPFAALDEITRSHLLDELANRWQQKRRAIVLITHNISEAVFLSNRVCVMSRRPGTVVAEVVVPCAFPRTPAFRKSPEFHELCEQVWAHLEKGSEKVLGCAHEC